LPARPITTALRAALPGIVRSGEDVMEAAAQAIAEQAADIKAL
jgi:hypothetical protein